MGKNISKMIKLKKTKTRKDLNQFKKHRATNKHDVQTTSNKV